MLDLEFIVKSSGDSILKDYKYSEGILTINLDLNEVDMNVSIKIKTNSMSFNNYYLDQLEVLYRTCRIEIQELSTILTVENGIYLPSSNFGKIMSERRLNCHLAYGEKATTAKYVFSLVGYDRLISCLLRNLDCISIAQHGS